MFLTRVCEALDQNGVKFAIAGGYAVALHGAVRGTVDVDVVVVISEENFRSVERAMGSLGLKSRLPVTWNEVFQFRDEYIKNRNMAAWSFVNPDNPTELVDIVVTHDLKDMKSQKISSGGNVLPVLSVSDLIKMKRASGRPQDLEDIKALEKLRREE